jgi:transposase
MRLKGSAEILEKRRRDALELLAKEEISLHEVGRRIGCHASSVMRWRDRKKALGEEGLKVRSSPGRPLRLSKEQRGKLLELLLRGPGAFGWRTEVWTTRRIAELIEREFRVVYHPDHVGRIMHALGWSHQKPDRRAIERNEKAIEDWKNRDWERVKKTPKGWSPT